MLKNILFSDKENQSREQSQLEGICYIFEVNSDTYTQRCTKINIRSPTGYQCENESNGTCNGTFLENKMSRSLKVLNGRSNNAEKKVREKSCETNGPNAAVGKMLLFF